jgi:hypothetical protein
MVISPYDEIYDLTWPGVKWSSRPVEFISFQELDERRLLPESGGTGNTVSARSLQGTGKNGRKLNNITPSTDNP